MNSETLPYLDDFMRAVLYIGGILVPLLLWLRISAAREQVRAFIRRHPIAVLLLLITLIVFISGYAQPENSPLHLPSTVAGWAFFLAGSWLFWCWTLWDVPERVTALREIIAHHRPFTLILPAVSLLGIVALTIWIAPWRSWELLQLYLAQLLILSLPVILNIPRLARTWGTPQWRGRKAAITLLAWMLLAIAFVGVASSNSCEQADCGGQFYRTAQPTTWQEQSRAHADSAARWLPPIQNSAPDVPSMAITEGTAFGANESLAHILLPWTIIQQHAILSHNPKLKNTSVPSVSSVV